MPSPCLLDVERWGGAAPTNMSFRSSRPPETIHDLRYTASNGSPSPRPDCTAGFQVAVGPIVIIDSRMRDLLSSLQG
jgi:hypothetical protein